MVKINYGKIFKECVESAGYELLGEYKKSNKKLLLKCSEKHEWDVTPNHFKSGKRCPVCAGTCPIQSKKDFIELVDEKGYELLGEYKNAITKIKLKCPKGHEWNVIPYHFKSGIRCSVCSGQCPKQSKKDFIELVHKEGYVLLGEYNGSVTKVLLKCPEGHEWKTTPNHFKSSGSRCGVCDQSSVSKPEIEVQEYVRSLDINFIENDRTTILNQETGYYLELDLWFPDLNKAIEFNGGYYHGPDFPETVKKDQYKKEWCEEKDVGLLVIGENEWNQSRKGLWRDIRDFLIDTEIDKRRENT